ncbi:SH3-domain-containing protein [Coniophora puteana RWD-64-598 SS2]|uniref:SH3-domain-containing protein n=1 Tax=Coniophora puteana (strain RWD-64-598) TaxID=741705 RepID=A0A5M3MYC6_CONPW|nr:SH3-domain-containing protein [Coniophora puteana RWD-64-598 SS2]EIW84173.1 SH3-domain-containing protein [Coniophora puteana RWD-64-598 SS2]
MNAPSDPQTAALLAHVAAQIQHNAAFLESQGYISPEDAATMNSIVSKLPVTVSISSTTTHVRVSSPPVATHPSGISAPRTVPPPPPVVSTSATYVRALWAYNEDGAESNDLSFSSGELIELVSQKNADWWSGRVRGKEGLFPSNHVEKVDSTAAPSPTSTAVTTAKKPYKPFGAALHGADTPPPSTTGINSVGLQQAPGQAEKKSKYGKYGNTMAHSAAGGVGFGAGSAIGGGLVRAIF